MVVETKEKTKKRIPTAVKRARIAERNRLKNINVKSKIKTTIKKILLAINAGEIEVAKHQYKIVCSLLDKARSKGILHKNTVSRKKSRLSKIINKSLVN